MTKDEGRIKEEIISFYKRLQTKEEVEIPTIEESIGDRLGKIR